ncbi:hypothetical protein DUD52_15085 [Listeria monocytogenes]|nr:hypothetical protein [Listeria monocytogenes]
MDLLKIFLYKLQKNLHKKGGKSVFKKYYTYLLVSVFIVILLLFHLIINRMVYAEDSTIPISNLNGEENASELIDKQNNNLMPNTPEEVIQGNEEVKHTSKEATGNETESKNTTDESKIKGENISDIPSFERGFLLNKSLLKSVTPRALTNTIKLDSNTFDLTSGNIVISDDTGGNLKIMCGDQSKIVASSTMITIVSSKTTSNTIEINSLKSIVNMTISNLNMLVTPKSTIESNAINLNNGTRLNLRLNGNNYVEVRGKSMAAIHVPKDSSLTIDGEGSLDVTASTYIKPSTSTGYPSGAGIGGNSILSSSTEVDFTAADSGTIIINSGTINATGDNGAGIGAGASGIARNIIINGGNIKATSQLRSAAIGSGLIALGIPNRTAEQHITINNGNIKTRSVQGGAAIGGGDGSTGGYITITGGIVEVLPSAGINAIGAGGNPNPGGIDSFSTGGNGSAANYGNAVILLSKRQNNTGGFISDMSQQKQWGGIIFIANEGHVYSNPKITKDFSIPVNYELKIDENESINNTTGITIRVDGKVLNKGTITGNANFINNGEVVNLGTIDNEGVISISSTGVVYNGSAEEQGKAIIQNSASSHITIEGNVYNFSKIEGLDFMKVTGNGNIYNLCNMLTNITKDGQLISKSNPIHYGDRITVKTKVAPGPYVNFPQWSSKPIDIQYKLWNGKTETPITGIKTIQRQVDGTAEVSETIIVKRTDDAPWEGGKELQIKAYMNAVSGLQGYLSNSNSETILYDKIPIDMSGAKWTEGDFFYDGNEKSVQIANLPSGVTSTYTDNVKIEPGIYSAIPMLDYDNYNYTLSNMETSFEKSLTEGYSWKINKAPVTVHSWPTATDLIDGQSLSSSVLNGGDASVNGIFVWERPEQTLTWNENDLFQDCDVNFVPLETEHYEEVPGKVSVKVKPIYYKVKLDAKGGTVNGDSILTVQKGNLVPAPSNPVYKDANFAGWYEDEAYSKLWDFDTNKVTQDTTLYAKYTAADPIMLVAIPNEIKIINNVAENMGEGRGSVNVQSITDSNIRYPNKILSIKTDSKIILNGKKTGARIDAQLYNEDNDLYNGTDSLITFIFNGNPPKQKEHTFSLKTPMNFDNPEDTYNGVLQFKLELK